MTTANSFVTVFGGTGFLGRRVVRHIRQHGFSVKAVACAAGQKPRLIPVPFAAWHVLAWFAKILPRPPITQNQVELMQIDTVASSERPGFKQLGITPVAVEEILQEILWDH